MKRKAKPDHSLLLFDWKTTDRSLLRMMAALLMTLGGLIGLILGFRILTPEVRAITTRPHQLLVLNPNIPAERALIHQAMDRSFPLLPADEGISVIPANAALPTFRPAIASFELKPKPITPGVTAAARPQYFALDLDVAMPLPKAAPQPPVDQPPSVLRAVIEGDIAERRLPDETALPGISLEEPSKPRFRIAVGPLGQVLMALPLASSEDAKVMAQLHSAVTALLFKPAPGKDVQWVQVSFRWGSTKEGGER